MFYVDWLCLKPYFADVDSSSLNLDRSCAPITHISIIFEKPVYQCYCDLVENEESS